MDDHFAELEGKYLIPKEDKEWKRKRNTVQQTGIEKREGGERKSQ